ncbi:MAG: AAA family ATPase [Oscillospiraceae bacterium]|jgi:chromosome partitioning protein|nr:AAA family ATPase [Oscillospiraceae bacterium]
MGRIISVANQKGGVGKTTTAVNLSASLGKVGFKVLLIDVDPQGNSTSGLGIDRRKINISTYDVMTGMKNPEEAIIKTEFSNLWLSPSNIDLAGAELELISLEQKELRLKSAISAITGEYDYILIDCSPSLGLVTANALCCSDSLLIPVQCEYYALEGLSQLVNTVRKLKNRANPGLGVEGVLLTMYDGRLNLTQQVTSEIKKYFSKKVFSTVIPRGVRISEAPSFGKPVVYFDENCKGSKAYMELAKEMINKSQTA